MSLRYVSKYISKVAIPYVLYNMLWYICIICYSVYVQCALNNWIYWSLIHKGIYFLWENCKAYIQYMKDYCSKIFLQFLIALVSLTRFPLFVLLKQNVVNKSQGAHYFWSEISWCEGNWSRLSLLQPSFLISNRSYLPVMYVLAQPDQISTHSADFRNKDLILLISLNWVRTYTCCTIENRQSLQLARLR